MMKKLQAMLAAMLAALSLGAQAKTVELHLTVDANQVTGSSSPDWYGGAPFTLSAGDTLTVEFSFLPGQALQITNPQSIGMGAWDVDTQTEFVAFQINSFGFVGLQGPAINPPSVDTNTSGHGIFNFFYPNQFMTAPDGTGTISFTGLKFGIYIQSYSDAVVDRAFWNVPLLVSGDNIHAVTAVPEPSTYALLALGLGAVGLRARARKQPV